MDRSLAWWRRPRLLVPAAAVLVGAAVVTAVLVTRSGGDAADGATHGWGPRWPLRGDLAGDQAALRDAVSAVTQADGTARDLHVLWAGATPARHVLIAGRLDQSTVLYDVGASGRAVRAGAFDQAYPLVAVPDLRGDGDTAVYLVAADTRLVAVLDPPDRGRPVRTDLTVTDGLARYRQPATAFDPMACDNDGRVVQVGTPEGTRYVLPWRPDGISADEAGRRRLTEDVLAALVAGATPCGADHPLTGWQPTELVGYGNRLTLPDGRAGTIIVAALRGDQRTAATLAWVPDTGGSAVFGVPADPDPLWRGRMPPGSADETAVSVRGLLPRPAILVIHAAGVTTVPRLSVAAHTNNTWLLADAPERTTVTYLFADGTPRASTVVTDRR